MTRTQSGPTGPFLILAGRLWRALLVLCTLTAVFSANADDDVLKRLDAVIRDRSRYEAPKREAIRKARIDYERATNDNDRYNSLRNLYEAYRSFRVDSALIVARERLMIARNLGIPSKIASATINLAEGYVRSGNPDMAIMLLDTLDRATLESYHIKYRSGVYQEAYRSKATNAILETEREEAMTKLKSLTDSALKESPKTSRGYYTLTADKLCDAGLYTEAVATMEEAARHFDFSEDPAMLATMGDIYLKAGRRDKARDYLAEAAILDISSGTKEYRSLISLTPILLEEGDVNRAFEYINRAFEDAQFSHANLRTAEIMKSMPVIDKAFHDTQEEVVKRTRYFLIAAGILVVTLLLLIGWYVKALRDNRRMLRTIKEINGHLAEKNEALAKADSLKLHYVNTMMKAYSEYITRLKAFRLKIFRFLKTGQYEKALDLVNSNRSEAGDISAFQVLFDEAFLSMFPDFIDRVNEYMKEEITLKEPSRLTPELRVIAMMKLRMASTDEISKLLHYSSQTVYNLRSTIRNMINIPWEDFEKKVMEF